MPWKTLLMSVLFPTPVRPAMRTLACPRSRKASSIPSLISFPRSNSSTVAPSGDGSPVPRAESYRNCRNRARPRARPDAPRERSAKALRRLLPSPKLGSVSLTANRRSWEKHERNAPSGCRRQRCGIACIETDVLVSVMEEHEYRYYEVPDLYEQDEIGGVEILRFAIRDMGIPKEAESEQYRAFVEDVVDRLRHGKNAVVHCRGGLGRTGTVAACVLVALGRHSADEAIDAVRAARNGTIQTDEQEDFVRLFEEHLGEPAP